MRTAKLPPFGREMLAEFQFDPGTDAARIPTLGAGKPDLTLCYSRAFRCSASADYHNFNFGSFGAVPRTVWAAFQSYQTRMEAMPDIWIREGASGDRPQRAGTAHG